MSKSSENDCPLSCDIGLPDWIGAMVPSGAMADDEACMALVLNLTERNIREETGGPFGALVLDDATRKVVALGVNMAPSTGNAVLHAETVALMLAAQTEGGARNRTLYASCEPCIMCLGAAHWSGINRIVFAALKEDAEAVGFNEGEGSSELEAAMVARGVQIRRGLMRDRAVKILESYCSSGGELYGPAKG